MKTPFYKETIIQGFVNGKDGDAWILRITDSKPFFDEGKPIHFGYDSGDTRTEMEFTWEEFIAKLMTEEPEPFYFDTKPGEAVTKVKMIKLYEGDDKS